MAKTKIKDKFKIEIKDTPYHHDASVVCSCGAKFNVGSTLKDINVEVCSVCHPFYTGTQKLVDTSGRVDKFKTRLAKKEEMLKKMGKNKEKKETSPDKGEKKEE